MRTLCMHFLSAAISTILYHFFTFSLSLDNSEFRILGTVFMHSWDYLQSTQIQITGYYTLTQTTRKPHKTFMKYWQEKW